jgi:hypothetical protein
MAELKDSGARRDFGTGAVRDVAAGKGRCDLLPLGVIARMGEGDVILKRIDEYIRTGKITSLEFAIIRFSEAYFYNIETGMLEAAKQYEDGCQKYGDRNWEKGIPLHCYIDSGVRHYLKFLRGDTDEPHDRAFLWNMLGAIWTHENKPELIDLPFAEVGIPTTEDKPVEPWGEEDKKRIGRICSVDGDNERDCSRCLFDKPQDSDLYLCRGEWLNSHPAEARKFMDEMEGKK